VFGIEKERVRQREVRGEASWTVRIGVMSVHVPLKSPVASRRWRHLGGSEARQRRTIATPKDLETSWKASTLVVPFEWRRRG
jgi:hypothetical protein